LTASTVEGYRDAVLRLLNNPQDREQFARNGRARVLSHHSWKNSMNKLDMLIEKCRKSS